MIYKNVTELIGKTPLMELANFSLELGLSEPILGKLEYFNIYNGIYGYTVSIIFLREALSFGRKIFFIY